LFAYLFCYLVIYLLTYLLSVCFELLTLMKFKYVGRPTDKLDTLLLWYAANIQNFIQFNVTKSQTASIQWT